MTEEEQAVAVNPASGEVLEHLDEQPPEALAEAFHAIADRQAEMKVWSDAVEAELRRRLKLRKRKSATFGDWEVRAGTTRESQWDIDELERVMRDLVDEGVLKAGDLTGVITREPVVARSRAKRLRDRLRGDARDAIDGCVTWRDKRGRMTVARSVALPTAAETVDGEAREVAAPPPEPQPEPGPDLEWITPANTLTTTTANATHTNTPTTDDLEDLFR